MTVDDRLREWGAGERAAAVAPRIPVDQFKSRRSSRLTAMAVAAIVVAVLAITLGALRSSDNIHAARVTDPTDHPAASVPNGVSTPTRNVTFHGLTVTVPAAWVRGEVRCGTPLGNAVWTSDDGTLDCAVARPVGVTDVRFATVPRTLAAGAPITVEGLAATRTSTVRNGLRSTTITVASVAASVTITSASSGQINSVISTLHLVSADDNGCLSHVSDLRIDTRYAGGTEQRLVPGHPTTLVACRYLFNYLQSSKTGNPAAAQDVLNRLPAGLSKSSRLRSGPGCWDHTDSLNADYGDASTAVLRFGYADGSTVTLRARIGFCGLFGVTNGSRTGQRLNTLVDLLSGLGVAGGSYDAHVQPAN